MKELGVADTQRQRHFDRLTKTNVQAKAYHDETLNNGLTPYETQLAHALIREKSLVKASRFVGVSKESCLHSFENPQFCNLVEQLHADEMRRSLEIAREGRTRAETELGYKAAGDLIEAFSDVITTALEKQHWSVTQIFKELKILMPARWVDEHH